MTTEEINQLINEASCIDNCVPEGMQLPVLVGFFAEAIDAAEAVEENDQQQS